MSSLPIEEIALYYVLGGCFGVLLIASLICTIMVLRSSSTGFTFQKTALVMTCIQCVFRTWSGFAAPEYYDDDGAYPTWLFVIHGQAPAMLFFSIYCFLINLTASSYYYHRERLSMNGTASRRDTVTRHVLTVTLVTLNALSYLIFVVYYGFLLSSSELSSITLVLNKVWKAELGIGYITGAALHVACGVLLFNAMKTLQLTQRLRKGGLQHLFLSLVCGCAFLIKGVFYFVTWTNDTAYVTSFLLLFLGEFIPLVLVLLVFRAPPPQLTRPAINDPTHPDPSAASEHLIPDGMTVEDMTLAGGYAGGHEAAALLGDTAPPLGITGSYADAYA